MAKITIPPDDLLLALRNRRVLRHAFNPSLVDPHENNLSKLLRFAYPDERGVLKLDMARSGQTFRRNIAEELMAYADIGCMPEFAFDDDFGHVVRECSKSATGKNRFQFSNMNVEKTIFPAMSTPLSDAFEDLHDRGEAHSISIRFGRWDIAAGTFGVRIGNALLVQSRFVTLAAAGNKLDASSRFKSASNFGYLADYLLIAYAHGLGCTQIIGSMYPASLKTRRGGGIIGRYSELAFDEIRKEIEPSEVIIRTFEKAQKLLGIRASDKRFFPFFVERQFARLAVTDTSPNVLTEAPHISGGTAAEARQGTGRRRSGQPSGSLLVGALAAQILAGRNDESNGEALGEGRLRRAVRRAIVLRKFGLLRN